MKGSSSSMSATPVRSELPYLPRRAHLSHYSEVVAARGRSTGEGVLPYLPRSARLSHASHPPRASAREEHGGGGFHPPQPRSDVVPALQGKGGGKGGGSHHGREYEGRGAGHIWKMRSAERGAQNTSMSSASCPHPRFSSHAIG